ncbi:hypothetical protein QJQ45_028391 [Haematococcus lacustris]|nr:hypothetical protein QJQ45_028391 [Haematococcus lacustris]
MQVEYQQLREVLRGCLGTLVLLDGRCQVLSRLLVLYEVWSSLQAAQSSKSGRPLVEVLPHCADPRYLRNEMLHVDVRTAFALRDFDKEAVLDELMTKGVLRVNRLALHVCAHIIQLQGRYYDAVHVYKEALDILHRAAAERQRAQALQLVIHYTELLLLMKQWEPAHHMAQEFELLSQEHYAVAKGADRPGCQGGAACAQRLPAAAEPADPPAAVRQPPPALVHAPPACCQRPLAPGPWAGGWQPAVTGGAGSAKTLIALADILRLKEVVGEALHLYLRMRIAQLLHSQGKYDQAHGLLTDVLAVYRSSWGEDHPETASVIILLARVDLALLYQKTKNYTNAEHQSALQKATRQFMQAFEVRKRCLGPQHQDTLLILAGEELPSSWGRAGGQLVVPPASPARAVQDPDATVQLVSCSTSRIQLSRAEPLCRLAVRCCVSRRGIRGLVLREAGQQEQQEGARLHKRQPGGQPAHAGLCAAVRGQAAATYHHCQQHHKHHRNHHRNHRHNCYLQSPPLRLLACEQCLGWVQEASMVFTEGLAVAEAELAPCHQLAAHCLLGQADAAQLTGGDEADATDAYRKAIAIYRSLLALQQPAAPPKPESAMRSLLQRISINIGTQAAPATPPPGSRLRGSRRHASSGLITSPRASTLAGNLELETPASRPTSPFAAVATTGDPGSIGPTAGVLAGSRSAGGAGGVTLQEPLVGSGTGPPLPAANTPELEGQASSALTSSRSACLRNLDVGGTAFIPPAVRCQSLGRHTAIAPDHVEPHPAQVLLQVGPDAAPPTVPDPSRPAADAPRAQLLPDGQATVGDPCVSEQMDTLTELSDTHSRTLQKSSSRITSRPPRPPPADRALATTSASANLPAYRAHMLPVKGPTERKLSSAMSLPGVALEMPDTQFTASSRVGAGTTAARAAVSTSFTGLPTEMPSSLLSGPVSRKDSKQESDEHGPSDSEPTNRLLLAGQSPAGATRARRTGASWSGRVQWPGRVPGVGRARTRPVTSSDAGASGGDEPESERSSAVSRLAHAAGQKLGALFQGLGVLREEPATAVDREQLLLQQAVQAPRAGDTLVGPHQVILQGGRRGPLGSAWPLLALQQEAAAALNNLALHLRLGGVPHASEAHHLLTEALRLLSPAPSPAAQLLRTGSARRQSVSQHPQPATPIKESAGASGGGARRAALASHSPAQPALLAAQDSPLPDPTLPAVRQLLECWIRAKSGPSNDLGSRDQIEGRDQIWGLGGDPESGGLGLGGSGGGQQGPGAPGVQRLPHEPRRQHQRALVLSNLAGVMAAQGYRGEALELYSEALHLAAPSSADHMMVGLNLLALCRALGLEERCRVIAQESILPFLGLVLPSSASPLSPPLASTSVTSPRTASLLHAAALAHAAGLEQPGALDPQSHEVDLMQQLLEGLATRVEDDGAHVLYQWASEHLALRQRQQAQAGGELGGLPPVVLPEVVFLLQVPGIHLQCIHFMRLVILVTQREAPRTADGSRSRASSRGC